MSAGCRKCGETGEGRFYASTPHECKSCCKERVRTNRSEKADYYREKDRERAHLPHRVELRRTVAARWKADPELKRRSSEHKSAWVARNPDKRKAQNAVNNAVRDGKLVPRPCERCGTDRHVHAHHDDYSKPLDVMWLCARHHKERHAELERGQK